MAMTNDNYAITLDVLLFLLAASKMRSISSEERISTKSSVQYTHDGAHYYGKERLLI